MSDPSSEEDPRLAEHSQGPPVRRSPRLAIQTSPPITDWPIEKILATLYDRNIQAPLGINPDQLFHFLLENIPEPTPTQATPTSGPKKATAKRKHCSRANIPQATKKRTDRPDLSSPIQDDPVMSALQNILLVHPQHGLCVAKSCSSFYTSKLGSDPPSARDPSNGPPTTCCRRPFLPTCCCHLSPTARPDPRRSAKPTTSADRLPKANDEEKVKP
ncbi:hypothetical protein Q7C36_007385 [Tachysurus vachellii]|uniref:Uncharacterized protein n=1 Tax=Tachysurus vachellii TaxID=175792 RepID=A0AA88N5C7_TACVA|nr:hypothetical protein Q7C36_007385 [Tachysurus vachellii]